VAEQLKIVIDADVVKAMGGLKQLEKSFKTTENSAKSFGVNVAKGTQQANAALAKIPNTSNSATFALTNLGRVAQDLPFGFLGIANNLNPLLESFQRLKAESGSTKTALKALGSSLLGAGGLGFALSIASSLLLVFGDKLFGAGKKTEEAARAIKSSFEVIGDATDSVQGDIANVGALVKAATDTGNSLKIQAGAIAELKKINKEFFGGLEAGKSSFEQITLAANNYTQSLITQAIVKGLQDEISELSKQIRAATKEYNDLTAKTTAAGKAVNNFTVKTGGGERALDQQASSINNLNSNYKDLQGSLQKSATTLGGLRTQFNSLTDEINKQVLASLKIKPPTVDDKDFKDQTDNILSRARQFVKEFGDIFVVPDLDETFFRGKKELLPIAQKLLDDVSKGNLKIKIPVQTDFELLPTETPLTKEQLDRLTEDFFKGIAIERNIPATITIDPTIQVAVDQGKLKKSLDEALSKGDFKGSLDLLTKIDLNPALQGIQGLNTSLAESALLISDTLTPAFQEMFDAIAAGENPLKAFFSSIVQSINQLIKKLIAAAIQAAILSAITAGSSNALGFSKIFGQLLGGVSNPGSGFGLGSQIAGRSFNNTLNVVVQGQISGQNILLAGQRAAGSNNR